MHRYWIGIKRVSHRSVLLCVLAVGLLTVLTAAIAVSPAAKVAAPDAGADIDPAGDNAAMSGSPTRPAPSIEMDSRTEPRVPIGPVTTPGHSAAIFRIVRPGAYYLTADVIGVERMSGIEVAADDVSIDLGGFALIGVPGSLDGIHVRPTRGTFWVRNGTIRDWGGSGVDAREAAKSQILDVLALRNGDTGFNVGPDGAIFDSISQGSPEDTFAPFPPVLCMDGACSQHLTLFLSLPVVSSITNETTLFASIPNALSVQKFNRANDATPWQWDGTNCMPSPEPGCASACFCVNAGEGFRVTVSAPASFVIAGIDGSTTIPLLQPTAGTSQTGTSLISLPYCSPTITTAKQLMDSIGFAQVSHVQKYLCTSDGFLTYTGRAPQTSANNFALVDGEAYLVKMKTTVNYTTVYSASCPGNSCSCPVGMACDDGDACTTNDTCAASSGAGGLVEYFDSVTPPALPAGWTQQVTAGTPADAWKTVSAPSDSTPNSAGTNEAIVVTNKVLDTPSISVSCSVPQMTFRNNYNLENGYDGGVLEIKIGAGSFQDILVAGGSFVYGGYNGTISTGFSSPIAGRSAWTGNSAGFITTKVNLPAAAVGQTIVIRWRVGTDDSVGGAGQFIDTVQIGWNCCTGVSAACNDSNTCTDDACVGPTPGCVYTPDNSNSCTDGNACTYNDTCSGGTCGGTAITCTDDQCNTRTCNGTSSCTVTPRANGTACNDGNSCTQTDSCQAGVCTGASPVVCTALDQCHVAGVCNTGTGVCTNPNKANGTACNDANACTQTDTCQTGTCTGANPVVCTALDQCHIAGTCNTGTGVCTNPNKANGTACNDANACTQTDTCQTGTCAGANPVVCTALDQCHIVGTCDTGTGVCTNPNKANGTGCNDANACTQTDTCQTGTCTGANPMVCTALDQCHIVGTCDAGTGVCTNPNKANGTVCNDANACTNNDTCSGGVCTGISPSHSISGDVTCDNQFAIYTAATEIPGMTVNYQGITACHPSASAISFNTTDRYLYISAWSDDATVQGLLHDLAVDGQPVSSGNSRWSVTYTDFNYADCIAPPPAMTATMAATIPAPPGGWIAPAVGCANPPSGQLCLGRWGNFSTIDLSARRTWFNSGGDPSPNAPFAGFNHREFLIFRLDMCNACGPNGSGCDDGNACTTGDTCTAGVCAGGTPVSCDDANPCTDDACNIATGACTHVNNTGSCNDGSACTYNDVCSGGTCGGTAITCTDDTCNTRTCNGTSSCTVTPRANGTNCNDGNACTQTDTCQTGVCTGGSPVVCTALDQCHVAGICNTGTGVCTNPNKANGTACNDGNACTQTDTCQTGTCAGANPVVCTALDQCHDVGTCNTGTGVCTNPNKANGTVCNDGNACTQTDTCQTGACTGANPVVCTASDQCHEVGTCNTGTGVCTNPNKANGTACNDGNACTQTDTCQTGACSGANPVVCTALDQCHVAGTCNTGTGVCTNPNKANGTACNDGNACTQTDTCQTGTCTGANPVVCTALDQCHDVGTCNTGTGVCTNPNKANGTVCNDGNACTQTDTCQTGACTGANPVVCTPSDQCHDVGTCNTGNGVCTNPNKANGTACNDGNACTQTDTCQTGACSGANPVVCTALDQCHVAGTCNTGTGVCTNPNSANGTACNDGSLCTQTDTCQTGSCTGTNPVVCTALDQCHVAGTCATGTGVCTNPNSANGTACNDGDACTQTDSCQTGACTGANPVVCTALDQCHVAGVCNPVTGICPNPNAMNGIACDDGGVCTAPDTCNNGMCGCNLPPAVTIHQNPTPVTIPVTAAVVSSSITTGPVGRSLSRVRVTTNISHPDNAHIDLTLTSPAGTVVTLTSDNGSTNDNVFNGTLWDDKANPSGQVPYASNHGIVTDALTANNVALTPVAPEEALAAFHGDDPNGTWTLRVSDDTDGAGGALAGWTLELTTLPEAASTSASTFTNNTPTVLADNPAVSTSSLFVAGAGTVIDRVRTTTFIRHTFPGDLDMTLRSPAGTVVTLSTDNGGTRDNVFNGTRWDDKADLGGQVPFAGDSFVSSGLASDTVYVSNVAKSTLVPEESLGAFQGENPNGVWTLSVADDSSGDTGTLDQWSLEITTVLSACNVTCNDFNACTVDSCDPQTGCVNMPVPCDDNNPCTDDSCNPGTGCVHTPRPGGSACSDGNPCTLNDSCVAGACTGTEVICDDNNPCTDNFCSPAGGGVCMSVPHDGLACDDGDPCTIYDHCQSGTCAGGSSISCNDGNPCTDDACDSSLPWGCVHTNNLLPCDDGDACTTDDICKAPAAGPGGIYEDFDHVQPPAPLPPGWTQQVIQGAAPGWEIVSSQSHTPPRSAATGDHDFSTDKVLTTPAFFVGCDSPVTFRNHYDLEAGYDGGILEISIESGSFTDIIAAGGSFVAGGYNATISAAYGSPIGGHQAWTGNSGGFIVSSVNLPSSAVGHSIRLRWRVVTDAEICDTGQFIDTITAGWCPNICSGVPTNCNDDNPCTDDACISPALGCVFTPDDGNACTDGDRCTLDHCVNGACVSDGGTSPRPIDDSIRVGKLGTVAKIEWSDTPGPYDVYVGTRTTSWSYNQICLASSISLPETTHAPVPAAGSLFFYLVARRSAAGESILGRDSGCNPIPNPSPCP